MLGITSKKVKKIYIKYRQLFANIKKLMLSDVQCPIKYSTVKTMNLTKKKTPSNMNGVAPKVRVEEGSLSVISFSIILVDNAIAPVEKTASVVFASGFEVASHDANSLTCAIDPAASKDTTVVPR